MISLIIPIYNTAKWLSQCLDSVLRQDYLDIEVILVNDASKDDSLCICQEYGSKDDRIIILNNSQNGGVELARHSGYSIARGEYVMYIDSDDWLDNPCVLSVMYRRIEDTNADYVETGMQRVLDRHKWIIKKCVGSTPLFIEQPELFDKYYLSFFGVNILSVNMWGKLYRKSVLDKADIKPVGVCMGEDLAYNIQLFPYLEKIYISDEVGYNYRMGGITSRYNPHLLPDLKRLYLLKEELIDKHQYYKAHDWIRFELKNVLKTDICQRIAYGIDNDKEAAISAILTEINDPIYAKLSEVDKSSNFWNDPFVKGCMAKDAIAMYKICHKLVMKEFPQRLLKRIGFKLMNFI